MLDTNDKSNLKTGLMVTSLVMGAITLYVSYKIFQPLLTERTPDQSYADQMVLPDVDPSSWAALPVQEDGRTKPFESAAIDSVRQITGRTKFQKHSAVSIMLDWVLTNGKDWEEREFILCDYRPLRRIIFSDDLEDGPELEEKALGKYISPSVLRSSRGFQKVLREYEALDRKYADKAMLYREPEHRKGMEVYQRLALFDKITQGNPTTMGRHPDTVHYVALDQVKGGPWFSVSKLRDLLDEHQSIRRRSSVHISSYTAPLDFFGPSMASALVHAGRWTVELQPSQWYGILSDRLSRRPHAYISPEAVEDLEAFQKLVKAGSAAQAIDELSEQVYQRAEETARQRAHLLHLCVQAKDMQRAGEVMRQIGQTEEEYGQLFDIITNNQNDADQIRAKIAQASVEFHRARAEEQLSDLKSRAQTASSQGYHPADDRFRMLHLGYLETKYPNLFADSIFWQAFPAEDAQAVLDKYTAVQAAYKAEDTEKFNTASTNFFDCLSEVSSKYDAYPGVSSLALERKYISTKPFMWAWIVMLASFVFFLASILMNSRISYWLGFGAYLISLGYQVFGFYARVAISGRPPVSNMYETLIFVPFMTAIFALILECIYRRKSIALGGSFVATLGLVLADQLPLVLDPKISPLVPVLRSNYWLIIHVLTIVASYAGGALAWALGNIAMTMIAFGKRDKETLNVLSTYTYRSIQIAVLLLAAGTFLGGWWAAESWGRFWGWDPKEVWALIALVAYVIPLHARYVGWLKDFGLAVSAVICFSTIMMSWYGVNFVLGAGLHTYGFGGGEGPLWVLWAGLLNIMWVLIAAQRYMSGKSVHTSAVDSESDVVEL